MKFLFKSIVLSIFLATQVNAQAETIAATAIVDVIINNIRNSISQMISEAETSATVGGFSFATDANILLQNLDILSKSLSGKIFSDLNKSQQAALSNATQILSETNRSLSERISDMNAVVNSLGGEISRIPGISKRPLVSKYSPSYILNTDSAYEITINGSLLNGKESTLVFGDKSCKQVSSVEQSSKFVCPKEIFNKSNNEWVTGILNLTKRSFWFWRDKYEYKIGVMAIQKELGSYKLSVRESRNTSRQISRRVTNSHRNDHCEGNHPVVWTYRPAQGCHIDVTSINVTPSISSNSTYNGVVNVSSNGFQVRGVVRNNGHCGPFGVPRDGRGNINVDARWTDVCSATTEASLPDQTGHISWDEEKLFPLSSTMTSFALTITQKDGKVKVVDKTTSSDWFVASYDPNSKLLIVKPRNITNAFN